MHIVVLFHFYALRSTRGWTLNVMEVVPGVPHLSSDVAFLPLPLIVP